METVESHLESRIEPFVERIKHLETSLEKKEMDIVLLKHTVQNLQRLADEAAKKYPQKK